MAKRMATKKDGKRMAKGWQKDGKRIAKGWQMKQTQKSRKSIETKGWQKDGKKDGKKDGNVRRDCTKLTPR